MLIDSNNPDNPDVQERLKDLYLFLENAESGSYLRARKTFIAGLDATVPASELALATCYYGKAEVAEAVRLFSETGQMPSSFFEPDCLRVPRTLGHAAPSSPTDPYLFIELFKSHGVNCVVGPNYPVTKDVARPDLAQFGSFYITGVKGEALPTDTPARRGFFSRWV